ncbi:MAG TPA: aminoacyl-tRNA hydrolase [Oligoflexia bacterium]|nr:aminoacyl-tRNA hydrolase [Oligoflexia bacterium]HMR25480.1 aminoacyl-tRNA hydrolase [Oligoflexia bacterium]
MEQTIKLIVGLGNPGQQYIETPHNAGFLLLDHFLDECVSEPVSWKEKGHALFCKVNYQNLDYYFLKPQNFMNRSGPVIQNFSQFYKINQQETLVIHDEVDLPLGSCKLKFSGGAGGHNGLRSIFQSWGKDFWRFRIGVDKDPKQDTAKYVLSRWSNEKLLKFIDPALADFKLILEKGPKLAMNQVNQNN